MKKILALWCLLPLSGIVFATSFSGGTSEDGQMLSPNLAGHIRDHMPFGKPNTLTVQQALDIAGCINLQLRPVAFSASMFCANDPATNLPNSLFKPAQWWSGCNYPTEPFTHNQRVLGPWAPIEAWRLAKIACLKAGACQWQG